MQNLSLAQLQKKLDAERKEKHGKKCICGKDEYCFFCNEDAKHSCAIAYKKWIASVNKSNILCGNEVKEAMLAKYFNNSN